MHVPGVCTAPLPSRSGGDGRTAVAHPCSRTVAFGLCCKPRALASSNRPSARGAPLPRGHRTKNAVQSVHLRSAMGEGSVLCTPGRRRAKMDGSGASGFSLKSYCSAIRVLQNVVIWSGFFTFHTEKIVLSQSSCIFVHGMSSDGNKCARCRTRAPRGPMKITTSRIPLLGDVPIGTTARTRIDPYRRINSLHRKQ